ncbi:MAG TPA: hypothetical protein VI056_09995 [Candidatus Limnocylindria bacterium]
MKESVVPVPASALRTAEWDFAYRAHGEALRTQGPIQVHTVRRDRARARSRHHAAITVCELDHCELDHVDER